MLIGEHNPILCPIRVFRPRIDTFSTDVCADINGQTEELTTAVCFLEKLKLGPDDATQFHREPVLVCPLPPTSSPSSVSWVIVVWLAC